MADPVDDAIEEMLADVPSDPLEQRGRLRRGAFTGEDSWGQLFSEPGSGTDMAGLGCRAAGDGDEWVVDEQKVWTTNAHLCNRATLIARTDLAWKDVLRA